MGYSDTFTLMGTAWIAAKCPTFCRFENTPSADEVLVLVTAAIV